MATYYFVGTSNSNWGTASNWSTSSGGSTGGVVPTSTDTAIFDANSQNCTVNVAGTCLAINFTGYTKIITMTNAITITTAGTVTLGTTTVNVSGASSLTLGATITLTSGSGGLWGGTISFGTLGTKTLTSNFSTTNLIINTTTTLSGSFNFNIAGNLTVNASVSGTATIVMNGTGTWSTPGAFSIGNNLNFNTSGTITISGTVYYTVGTLTYTSGTMITTSSTLDIVASCRMNTSTMNWNNITCSTSLTITLLSNLNLLGSMSTGVIILSGLFNVNIGTSFGGNGLITGTATIVMTGTGTLSNTNSGQYISCNLTINTSGTITLGSFLGYNTGILTYTSGSVISTGNLLTIFGSCTLNTSGMSWNNITLGTAATITFSSNIALNGTLLISATITTAGSYNISVLGSLTVNATISGPATIIMGGTGTWSGGSAVQVNLTFNTLGTITVSGSVAFNTKTMTYTAGTVTTTSSTLTIGASATMNTSTVSWNNVNVSGGTLTLTSTINSTGTFTISGSSTAISGATYFNPTGNLTMAGPTAFTMPNAVTVVNFTLSSAIQGLNGFSINITGNCSFTAAGYGSTVLNMTGTGTLSTLNATTYCTFNMNINTTGTITFGANFSFGYTGNGAATGFTFTYTSGTVDTTTNSNLLTLSLIGNGQNFNTAGMSWYDVTIISVSYRVYALSTMKINHSLTIGNANNTYLAGFWDISTGTVFANNSFSIDSVFKAGNLTCASATGTVTIGVFTGTPYVNVYGNITTGTTFGFSGINTPINLVGTGTWSGTGPITNALAINTAGTITISGTVGYNTGILSYTMGTVITTGSTINVAASCTFNTTSSVAFNNITLTAAITLTINSLLVINGTLSLGSFSQIFNGTAGFTAGTFSSVTAGVTHIFQANVTYTITGAFTITGTAASHILLKSSSTSIDAYITVTGNQDVGFCDANYINSSGGNTVWTYQGVINASTVNWNLLHVFPQLTAFTFLGSF